VQAGPPVLESRRAVSGGATATRAASAGGDALPRRAPCTPDTHQRKHTAAGGRVGASVYAEADKTRFRLTWIFSFTLVPSLIRSATSSTMPFSAA
jgi:hypothetical protein